MILIINLYLLLMSTIFTTFDLFDDDYPHLSNGLSIFFTVCHFASYIVIVIFIAVLCKECNSGEQQGILHPGTHFDPRDHFDNIPVIIYQPFSNLKNKTCAIWLMDYEQEDSIKVMPIWFHTYHSEWIRLWFNNNSTWPFWRKEFTKEDIDKCKDMSEDELYRWIQASVAGPSMFNAPSHDLERYRSRSSRTVPFHYRS